VGCRQRRSQAALVRCVLTDDGRAVVDRSGPGRGAWLCIAAQDCFELARRRKAFERAWRRPVGPEALAELGRQLDTLAERAGDEVRDDEKG
jgi:predicted RNA-binding protein YlxR (DUF448 family)